MAARAGRKKRGGGRAAGGDRAGNGGGDGKRRKDQKGTDKKAKPVKGTVPPGNKGTVPAGSKGDGPAMGAAARLIGMVVNPLPTLDDILRRPRVLTAASLLLATNLLFVLLIWDKIHEHAAWLIEHAPPAGVPAEELPRFADQAPAVAATDALLGPAITWFMIALLLRILAGGTGRPVAFGVLFNVTIFGMVPHMLGLYLDSVVRFFADVQRPDFLQLGLNASYLVPGGAESRWFPLLAALHPFTIWGLALTAVGGAKLLNVKVARVAVPLLGLWFLLAIIRTFSSAGTAG